MAKTKMAVVAPTSSVLTIRGMAHAGAKIKAADLSVPGVKDDDIEKEQKNLFEKLKKDKVIILVESEKDTTKELVDAAKEAKKRYNSAFDAFESAQKALEDAEKAEAAEKELKELREAVEAAEKVVQEAAKESEEADAAAKEAIKKNGKK